MKYSRHHGLLHPWLLLAVSVTVPNPASAWSQRGHMIVAAAWEQMTSEARARACELLKLNPDYEAWVGDVPANQRDKGVFVRASRWADDIKSTKQDDGNQSLARPTASRNIVYSDPFKHEYWHYKGMPCPPSVVLP